MTKRSKEELVKLIGEGKYYEVLMYGDNISTIKTKVNDFLYNSDYCYVFFDEVTSAKDSKIVSEILKMFGDDVRIAAYTSTYTMREFHPNDYVFDEYNDRLCVTDTGVDYIVCSKKPISKKKLESIEGVNIK